MNSDIAYVCGALVCCGLGDSIYKPAASIGIAGVLGMARFKEVPTACKIAGLGTAALALSVLALR
jgi:hypothetical protein